jgi:predicted kinase
MKPKLYLFVGYPGAGKTTVAQFIAKKTGAEHVWADVERHRLFGDPTHTDSESTRLYNELNQQTDQLLSRGHSVIFDTNFNHRADRDKLRSIANQHGAETVIIWVNTPLRIAKERAVHSNVVRNNYDFTMSQEQFDAIAAKLEAPDESEPVIKIDGTHVDWQGLSQLLNL